MATAPDNPVGCIYSTTPPGSFPPEVVVEVGALACELPVSLGLPLSRLSVPDIRSEAIARGIVAEISEATVWRSLSEDPIRPWTFRSWIFPRDPDFGAKAGRVLDLYGRRWKGKPLHPGEPVAQTRRARSDPNDVRTARPRLHDRSARGPSLRKILCGFAVPEVCATASSAPGNSRQARSRQRLASRPRR